MQKKSKNKEKYQEITKMHYIKTESLSKKPSGNLKNKNSGITLLALCITIIVIIILASITIGTISGDNGILNNATMAKEKTEIADEKEIIGRASVQSMGKNKRGDLEQEEFQEELDRMVGEGETRVTIDLEDYNFFVRFEESKRIYKVDRNGNVKYLGIETELITQAEVTAEPESNTTPELTQTVELTIETPILIEGAEYSLVYAWNQDNNVAPEDSQFTEEKNLEGTGRIRKATVNSNDTEEGDYYLWVRIVVGEIEKEKCFGPYAIKDHTTLAKVENNENTATSGFLGSEEKNEDVTRGKIEKIEIANTKTGHSVEDENCWDVSQSKNGAYLAWYEDKDNDGYYEITIGGEGGVVANSNSSNLFANIGYGVENQEVEIIGLENLDTELVTNMSRMFQSAKMQELDLNSFNTNKVTTLLATFAGCTNLTKLEVNNWNTSNVTEMGTSMVDAGNVGTFQNCSKLTELNISKWNTKNVKAMGSMFREASSLITLDLTNFDTSNVTNMYKMFEGCSKLKDVRIQSFDTHNVTNMQSMFKGCSNLEKLDIRNFNTSNVTNMQDMFSNCKSLVNLNLSNFDTSKVVNMANMFRQSTNLSNVDVSNFNINKVINFESMFYGCESLTNLNLDSFNESNVTNVNMKYMFYLCKNLTDLKIDKLNTSNVTNMAYMFSFCNSLKELDVTNFDTKNVTTMAGMFQNCINLLELDVSNFDTSNVTDMSAMFRECKKIKELDLSNFNTENVTNMWYMFAFDGGLESLNIANFNVEKVTNWTFILEDVSTTIEIITNASTKKWLNEKFPNYTNIIEI